MREGREGSRTSLPSPPLLFIPFFTSHRSPLSERLEQASETEVDLVLIQTSFDFLFSLPADSPPPPRSF